MMVTSVCECVWIPLVFFAVLDTSFSINDVENGMYLLIVISVAFLNTVFKITFLLALTTGYRTVAFVKDMIRLLSWCG